MNVRPAGLTIAAVLLLAMTASGRAQSEIKVRVGPTDRLPPVDAPRRPQSPPARVAWSELNFDHLHQEPGLHIAPAPSPAPGVNAPDVLRDKLSIAQLESLARCHNPTLAQAARRIEALHGKCVQVGLYPNPVIGYLGEEIGDDDRAGQQGGYVGQEVVTAGKLRLNRAVVSHEIAMARRQWEIQSYRVANDVRAGAYAVIAAQRMVELNEQLLRIGNQGLATAEKLFKAEEVSKVDVLQARIEANSVKLQLQNAKNDYQAAWRRLVSVVGLPEMQPVPLEDSLEANLPARTWSDSLMRLLGSSPELSRAYAQVERAKCFLARQQAERVPNLDLEAALQYDNATTNNIATARIAAPLKIFNRNQGAICEAQAELAGAHQNVRRTELALQKRLAAAYREYVNAKQQVDLYRGEILIDARKSLDLVQQGYRQSEFGYLELLTAQRTYFRTHLAYVHSLQALWVSNTMIEGMLLSGGLEAPGEPTAP